MSEVSAPDERAAEATVPVSAMDAMISIMCSASLPAMEMRRVEQLLRHGHSPSGDRALPLDRLPREALKRIRDALDKLTPWGGDLDLAEVKLETAGACLAAALDVIRWRKEQRHG